MADGRPWPTGCAAAAVAFAALVLTGPAAAETATPAEPTLAPAVEKPARQLTTCWKVCGIGDWLTGGEQSVVILLRQTSSESSVTAESAQLVLEGDHDGRYKELEPSVAHDPERVVVDTSELNDADHYAGTLTVVPSNGADPVSIPVTINVRGSALEALLWLLGSVAVGAFISWLVGLRPRAAFRSSGLALRDRIKGMPAAEQSVLMEIWQDTWDERLVRFKDAQVHLASLEKGADALRDARDLQDEALRFPYAPNLVPWVQRIGSAVAEVVSAVRSYAESYHEQVGAVRDAVDELASAAAAYAVVEDLKLRARAASAKPGYSDFQAAAKQLDDALKGVPTDIGNPVPHLQPLVAAVEAQFKELEKYGPLAAVEAGAPVPAGVGGAVAGAAGLLGWWGPAPGGALSSLRFDLGAGLARVLLPFAGLAALVVLLAVGFKVTYLDNKTFGATGADYLALVLWGVAAWGTRATLTGIGKPTEDK